MPGFPDLYPEDRNPIGRLYDARDRVRTQELRAPGTKVLFKDNVWGPYPMNFSFTVQKENATIFIWWQGTLIVTTATEGQLGLNVDGTHVDDSYLWIPVVDGSHPVMPMGAAVIESMTSGAHSGQVTLLGGTSDLNDNARVIVMELA